MSEQVVTLFRILKNKLWERRNKMAQHTERFGNGLVTYSSVDAEFQFEGETTYMEVHHYCGPSFYTIDKDEGEQWIYPDDDPKWNLLWKEYEDWVLRTTGVKAPSHQNHTNSLVDEKEATLSTDDDNLLYKLENLAGYEPSAILFDDFEYVYENSTGGDSWGTGSIVGIAEEAVELIRRQANELALLKLRGF